MKIHKVRMTAMLLACMLVCMSALAGCAAQPEVDAKASEILYVGPFAENYIDGKTDLDGDGRSDKIYFETAEEGAALDALHAFSGKFRVRVNEAFVECFGDNVDPLIMVYSPDGKQLLLAVYDDGPSNDPRTDFYKYDDDELSAAGTIPDDIRSAIIDDEGLIQCSFRVDMIQTEYAVGYYYWDGSEIVKREDEVYYYLDDTKWREENQMPLLLKKEITVYTQPSENSESMVMKAQQIRNAATDGKEWILLEAKDGMQGWLRVEQFNVPSEESTVFELFEGLNMAD